MNRNLVVMRHAKSSWSSGADSDHARPLKNKGRRQVPLVAARLVKLEWIPQHVLCSDAARTKETCQLLCHELPEKVGAEYLPSLYHAGPDVVERELSRVPDTVRSVLLLGHNPGWEELVERLCGEHVVMKTGSAALLAAPCARWSDAFGTKWSLREVIDPDELGP
jgi:phosphohistidine phosphatase